MINSMPTKNSTKKSPPRQPCILLRLEGDLKTQFEALHKKYGFMSKTNTLRMLITERYNEDKKAGKIP
jgi:hypothetical protein